MKNRFLNNHSELLIIGLLILTIVLGGFFRFYHIGKNSIWGDEAFTFIVSQGSVIEAIKRDPNVSLYYALLHFWIRFFPNTSDGTYRALSAIFSIANIPIVFLLARTMTINQKKANVIGLITALLISINAYDIQYAQELRSYSLTLLLTTLSTYLVIKIIEDNKLKHQLYIIYTIVTAAAVYSHFYAVFIIVAQAVTLPALLLDKNILHLKIKRILFCGIGITCLILPIFILAYQKGSGQISWLSEPTFKTVVDFFYKITGNQGRLLSALYLLFACIGLFFGAGIGNQQDLLTKWKFTLMVSCLLFPVIASLIISKIITPVFLDRYLIIVMPYLSVLAAVGIVTITGFVLKTNKLIFFPLIIGVLALFTLLSTMGVKYYYDNFQTRDWRSVTHLLTTRCSESLRLYYPEGSIWSILYYNNVPNFQDLELLNNTLIKNNTLINNLDSDKLVESLSTEYRQICLVLEINYIGQKIEQEEIIRSAIKREYPNESTYNFFGVRVDIYGPK